MSPVEVWSAQCDITQSSPFANPYLVNSIIAEDFFSTRTLHDGARALSQHSDAKLMKHRDPNFVPVKLTEKSRFMREYDSTTYGNMDCSGHRCVPRGFSVR
jgi:hypothetical protein